MASGADGKSRDIALTKQFLNSEGAFIVYDDAKVSQFNPRWFEPEAWPDAERTAGKAGGRGAVIFISPPETPPAESQWVLRHYYRGGLPGKIIDDRFVWTGPEGTRSWREWQLLAMIHAQGLPAPAPVAARYVRHGLFYTADLITERLPDVLPLSTRLTETPLSAVLWQSVGECIAQFHGAGFFHADLNAHNLQIGSKDKLYLLDWDRGEQREPGGWAKNNLARLQRSLEKIKRQQGAHFGPADWANLESGYAAAMSAHR